MDFPIGFMQGRLSSIVDGKIQAFPRIYWRDEFHIANQNRFKIMEWVLDQDNLYENPLMTEKGREEIKSLMYKHSVSIPALTGGCFMQAPFYKTSGNKREKLLLDLKNILNSCKDLGIKLVMIPLVDSGRIENISQEKNLKKGLDFIESELGLNGIKICFESDFNPRKLANFIDGFSAEHYSINYDIGDSASLGYDQNEEIELYGHRIVNVHIKDRLLHGTTVPLGEGNADFPGALRSLLRIGYKGNYILQTARSKTNNHLEDLLHYRTLVSEWLKLAEKN